MGTRKSLMNMKRRYSSEITPIARASEAMNAANELRARAGHDAIFEVGEYNSIDDFLHGKTANNKYQSREALTKKTAAMTEAAMAEALQDPEFKKFMGDQFWLITQHTGGSYADLMAAIENNPQAQSRFAEIKQRVMKDAGVDRYDAAGKQAIEDAINTGLYAGLDKPVKSFQANADHVTPVQRHQMRVQDAQLQLERDKFNWQKSQAAARGSGSRGSGGGSGSGTERAGRLKGPLMIKGHKVGNNGSKVSIADNDEWRGMNPGQSSFIEADKVDGVITDYNSLPTYMKQYVDAAIGNDDIGGYTYYVGTTSRGTFRANDETLTIVPKTSVINQASSVDSNLGLE
jgi:hypothetical protein